MWCRILQGDSRNGVATFTVWENPKVGFKAASGFWIAGRYDMGDDIKKRLAINHFSPMKKMECCMNLSQAACGDVTKTIAEYALNHGADRVYCYQALTVCYLVDYNVQVAMRRQFSIHRFAFRMMILL